MTEIITINGGVKDSPLISIGVLTIPEREKKFKELKELILLALEPFKTEVEFLAILSPKGTPSIGEKRNIFIDNCKGEYCVMVDDDDKISPDFFNYVVPVLLTDKPDAVGCLIDCEFYINDRYDRYESAIVSNDYTGLSGNSHPRYDHAQGIYYKVPIKTELARKVRFKDISFAEDQDFSIRLKPLLKNCSFINAVLYYYIYNRVPGETRAQRYGDETL